MIGFLWFNVDKGRSKPGRNLPETMGPTVFPDLGAGPQAGHSRVVPGCEALAPAVAPLLAAQRRRCCRSYFPPSTNTTNLTNMADV